jgi:hypothetical protein
MTTIFTSLCLFAAIYLTIILIVRTIAHAVTKKRFNFTYENLSVSFLWALFYLLNNL